MADNPPPPDSSPHSTPALISFAFLAIFVAQNIGVFYLLKVAVKIDPVILGPAAGMLNTTSNGLAAVVGFWLASSLTANRANATKDAVIAQVAGAGPPPPASPMDPSPAPPLAPVAETPAGEQLP